MATNKNTIPAGLYAYFVETDVFAAGEFAAGLDVEERGNRVVIHADAATLAAFGDYIWSVAGLVEDRIRTRAEVGYGWKQLKEISKRFPTRDEVAAELAEAAAADEAPEADAAPAIESDGRAPVSTPLGTPAAIDADGAYVTGTPVVVSPRAIGQTDYREAAVVSVDGPARYVVQYADGSRETVRRGRVSAGHLVVTVRYTGSVWDAEAPGGYRRVHPGIGRLTDETAPAAVESGTVTAARGTYRLRSLHRDVTVDFRPLGSWKRHSRSSRRETLIAA